MSPSLQAHISKLVLYHCERLKVSRLLLSGLHSFRRVSGSVSYLKSHLNTSFYVEVCTEKFSLHEQETHSRCQQCGVLFHGCRRSIGSHTVMQGHGDLMLLTCSHITVAYLTHLFFCVVCDLQCWTYLLSGALFEMRCKQVLFSLLQHGTSPITNCRNRSDFVAMLWCVF